MFQTCFICHSSTDANEAMGLALAMEAKGCKCWIAPRNLPAGADYAHEIVEGIRHCEAFLILLTNQAVSSTHIQRELGLASELGKKIIPVRVPGVIMGNSMEYLLKTFHWIDASPADLWSSPERIADKIMGTGGSGSVAASRVPEGKKAPAFSRITPTWAILAAVLIFAAWWGWGKWTSVGATPADPVTSQSHEVQLDGESPEVLKAILVPEDDSIASEPTPGAEELPKAWTCTTIAGKYRIEWAMTFTPGAGTLEASGHKAVINGVKAGRKERITTLEMKGKLLGTRWEGTYVEDAQVGKPVEGTFELTFSENLKSFEGTIYSQNGTSEAIFNGEPE